MNIVSSNTTTNPSLLDGVSESEQLVCFTRYTRNHSGGGHTDFFEYIAASNGNADIRNWVKDYLSEEKEELYLRALRNLFRKLDFIELNQSLDSEAISEEEYDLELNTNEDSYLIPAPVEKPTLQQIIQISDIIRKIGREKKITVDEVSEIFSLEMDKAMAILQAK